MHKQLWMAQKNEQHLKHTTNNEAHRERERARDEGDKRRSECVREERKKVEDKAKCERLYNFAFLIRLDCSVWMWLGGAKPNKFSAIFHGFVHISIC